MNYAFARHLATLINAAGHDEVAAVQTEESSDGWAVLAKVDACDYQLGVTLDELVCRAAGYRMIVCEKCDHFYSPAQLDGSADGACPGCMHQNTVEEL